MKIGIIGAGLNTRVKHIPGFQAIDGVQVVAVSNRSKESGEKVAAEYKKGDKTEVKILDINVDKERISLGIKQLSNDPIQDFIEKNPIKSKVTGKIVEIDDKGIKINLSENIFGFIKNRMLFLKNSHTIKVQAKTLPIFFKK